MAAKDVATNHEVAAKRVAKTYEVATNFGVVAKDVAVNDGAVRMMTVKGKTFFWFPVARRKSQRRFGTFSLDVVSVAWHP